MGDMEAILISLLHELILPRPCPVQLANRSQRQESLQTFSILPTALILPNVPHVSTHITSRSSTNNCGPGAVSFADVCGD